jgi:hypothetical protein
MSLCSLALPILTVLLQSIWRNASETGDSNLPRTPAGGFVNIHLTFHTHISCSIVEVHSLTDTPKPPAQADMEIAKPTRPAHFRLFTVIPFTSLFVALAVVGAVLFIKSRPHGKIDIVGVMDN